MESLNPQTQWFVHPILGCVFLVQFLISLSFPKDLEWCCTLSYHVLRLTALISLVCEHVWLDWYRSLAAELTCTLQISKTLLLLTSLLTDLERKGNFALLVQFAAMAGSRLPVHPSGAALCWNTSSGGCLGAALPACSTAAAAQQAASVRAAPTLLLSVPVQGQGTLKPPGLASVCVCVSSCVPKTQS